MTLSVLATSRCAVEAAHAGIFMVGVDDFHPYDSNTACASDSRGGYDDFVL